MYLSLNIVVHLADSEMTKNLKSTQNYHFHRPLPRVIAGTMRYSSTTAIPWENMRLLHLLVEKVVYNSYAFKPRIIVQVRRGI